MKFNSAQLKDDSPFAPIFPDRKAPIKNVFRATRVKLERNPKQKDGPAETEEDAYLLDWSRCSLDQRIKIAEAIAIAFGNVTAGDFAQWMNKGGDLPIRVSSTSSATLGADMRSFL